MKKLICIVAVASTAGVSGSAQLLNGSFESSALGNPGRISILQAENWVASGGFMLLERGVNGISNIAAHTGEQFISIGHNATTGDTLAQAFATEAGTAYTVSFFTNVIQGSGDQELTASAIEQSTTNVLGSFVAESSERTDEWVEHTFSFTAASAETQLQFVHTLGHSGANLVLDTVTVTIIPSPASVGCMLAAGGFAVRRRRH
ncbi:MAG: DUF642 domain-containing protein [Planctomycetota bacterium]